MMNTEELTAYIKNYLENDKTRSAIMLTGAWGRGKSYYIQNVLANELNKCNYDIAIVSLYGLKTIAELNKSIYLELRAKKTLKKLASKKKNKETKKNNKLFNWLCKHGKEAASGTALLGKTIIKGVAGFFNVPVEFSDKDLEKLYTSINLNGKLIVLEDLERSGIDIIEIMGYVNNLVEQDGVKVLLVANENEIIKYEVKEETDKDGKKIQKKVSTKITEEYLRIKEKTVSDTISFYADINDSVENILRLFNNHYFNEALKEKTDAGIPLIVDEIENVMFEVKCYNLRALLYSCQKTLDMFLKSLGDCEISYFRFVLCSNTAFALKLSQNSNLEWTDNIKSPNELGSYHFPLYRCCYDYIKRQFFDSEQFKRDESSYIRQKTFEVKQKDLQTALDILYIFYEKTETEVSAAVEKIYEYLKEKENFFPFGQYSKLANYLIAARQCVNDEKIIDSCKEEILNKLHGIVLNNEVIHDLTYHDGIELWTDKQKDEYSAFKQEMLKDTKVESIVVLGKISSPDDVKKLADSICDNFERYVGGRDFAGRLDIDGILDTLPNCNAGLIGRLRGAIMQLYRSVNIADFLAADKPALALLKEGIVKMIADGKIDDKVKVLQLEWFIGNLEDIITRLS